MDIQSYRQKKPVHALHHREDPAQLPAIIYPRYDTLEASYFTALSGFRDPISVGIVIRSIQGLRILLLPFGGVDRL